MSSPYIELHAASAFSFLQGASLPEALVDRAAELGYSALALVDRDGVYGAPRFHKAARSAGLKPIIGAELTISGKRLQPERDAGRERAEGAPPSERERGWGPASSDKSRAGRAGGAGKAGEAGGAGGARDEALTKLPDDCRKIRSVSDGTARGWGPAQSKESWLLPVLCESQEGYRNLCRLVTRLKLSAPKGEGALALEDFEGSTGGLVALVGRAALDGHRYGVGGLLDRVIGLFGRDRTFVELQRHFRRDEEADNRALITLASAFDVPTIATGGVRFATSAERPLFDVLTCIHLHTDVTHAGRRLVPNAERYLKPPADVAALFRDLPDTIARTRDLADRLEYTMADLGYRFPDYPVPAGESAISFLRKITEVGACGRYRPYHDRARRQIARELDLIEKLELAGYFLIVWDIVNFCRQHDILVQGRGSAANSAVCYSLGITAVDPVGMDLLFERFLSEERGEWPDIDLDLPSGDRREQVIQHVYEKYGRLGAAMTANVITYRGRSAAREVGKALGFDPAQVDRLAKVMNNFEFDDPAETLPRHLASVGLDASLDRVRLFATLWEQMQDLPRHLGQHSGGMVMCKGQLDSVVPLENASMPGRVVVQWDKDDCADMGIVKVDLLGLGMMAVLQDAITLVNQPGAGSRESGVEPRLDLAHLPSDDPAVYRMLQEADTIGVFQVESRAQMATLPRLKPASFYDIVVEVAIIRPGPIVGQMVHPYLNRRAGREPVQYPHPSLEPILARTLGVPLFQEQLLRIAMVAAGFTGGQAEDLRRAFGFKRSERRMKQIEVQLREGMERRGITGEAAEQIITSITSFALYGFPESHAASFALLAYASSYLKVHYPSAFYTALLNNQPMGFYHPATLVKDAQRRGVRFQPIDVQVSDWDCAVEADGSIRLGLRYVSGLREQVGRAICCPAPRGRESTLEAEGQRSPANAWGLGPPLTGGRESTLEAEGQRSSASAWGWGPTRSKRCCPKCGCDDPSMIEDDGGRWFCNNCSHDWVGGAGTASGWGSTLTRGRESTLEAEGQRSPASAWGWGPTRSKKRFASLDDLIARTGLRRDEIVTLADIGALNSFGYDRRSALWQAERAIRPAGELFESEGDGERLRLERGAGGKSGGAGPPSEGERGWGPASSDRSRATASRGSGPLHSPEAESLRSRPMDSEARQASGDVAPQEHRLSGRELQPRSGASATARRGGGPLHSPEAESLRSRPRDNETRQARGGGAPREVNNDLSPLNPMTEAERLTADYAGTGLTVGRHPMALRRDDLAMRGILRASDLRSVREGRRIRVAGMVITRQRPGTAKGFVFLTLEDETGIANIIVRPDLFARDRLVIIGEPFLIVDGMLQNQDGVTSVRAERVLPMRGLDIDFDAHDFY